MRHRLTSCLLMLASLFGALFAVGGITPAGAATSGVAPHDGDGIHVVSTTALSDRLLDSTLSTGAVGHPVGVRVLLPSGYDPNGTTRYPVLYLLHGGFGSYVDWTDVGGVTQLTAGLPLIVVMPDAGKGGWYSNWSNFGLGGSPAWETFHIDQLIPWVDANFRTVGSRSGRAIAGLSMGGFGAMSYAARHPGTFAAVASFSGAVDIQNPLVAALIGVSPVIDGGLPGSIYGIAPFDQPGLADHNPANMAANLRGMHVALYTGNGQNGPLDSSSTTIIPDIQETVVHANNVLMNDRLDAAGVAHDFNDYGNGTHSFGYWTRDLSQELPKIMATFADPTPAGNAVVNGGFEGSGMSGWQCLNRCGVDHGLGLDHSGDGNGWVRNNRGWNDIHTTVPVAARTTYRLTGWVRTSSNSDNGYFGVRTTNGTVLDEARFTRFGAYTKVSVDVHTGANTNVVVYGGVWTDNGDIWMQLDDVSLTPA
jgi:S-formylglutathione hydrolase FrmB